MLASVPEAPALTAGTVAQAAARLRPGQYLWAPQVAPSGPMIMVVNLRTQRATVYRNGIPIGITTVSSGRPGHETPPGVYTILQKEADHRSNLYNNAPMPFMQRLTWDGIALHGGALPGYPASHGCIRLPEAFARLLFAESRLGMMVVVTRLDTMPVMAATEAAPLLPVNRRPKRTPHRRAKGTPFVEQRDGYDGRTVRAGCGVGRA